MKLLCCVQNVSVTLSLYEHRGDRTFW